jgi:hypothetical protein
MRYKFRRIGYGIKERIFVIFFTLVCITFTFFIIVKSVEKPKIYIVKTYEFGNLYIFIAENFSSIFEIAKIDIIRIEYPPFKPKEFCLDYTFVYDKDGNKLKKCFSTNYETVIGKEIVKIPVNEIVDFQNSKLILKNVFNFSINLEIFIKFNTTRNVYRNNILILQNVSVFSDNYIIAPFEIVKYNFE